LRCVFNLLPRRRRVRSTANLARAFSSPFLFFLPLSLDQSRRSGGCGAPRRAISIAEPVRERLFPLFPPRTAPTRSEGVAAPSRAGSKAADPFFLFFFLFLSFMSVIGSKGRGRGVVFRPAPKAVSGSYPLIFSPFLFFFFPPPSPLSGLPARP